MGCGMWFYKCLSMNDFTRSGFLLISFSAYRVLCLSVFLLSIFLPALLNIPQHSPTFPWTILPSYSFHNPSILPSCPFHNSHKDPYSLRSLGPTEVFWALTYTDARNKPLSHSFLFFDEISREAKNNKENVKC